MVDSRRQRVRNPLRRVGHRVAQIAAEPVCIEHVGRRNFLDKRLDLAGPPAVPCRACLARLRAILRPLTLRRQLRAHLAAAKACPLERALDRPRLRQHSSARPADNRARGGLDPIPDPIPARPAARPARLPRSRVILAARRTEDLAGGAGERIAAMGAADDDFRPRHVHSGHRDPRPAVQTERPRPAQARLLDRHTAAAAAARVCCFCFHVRRAHHAYATGGAVGGGGGSPGLGAGWRLVGVGKGSSWSRAGSAPVRMKWLRSARLMGAPWLWLRRCLCVRCWLVLGIGRSRTRTSRRRCWCAVVWVGCSASWACGPGPHHVRDVTNVTPTGS